MLVSMPLVYSDFRQPRMFCPLLAFCLTAPFSLSPQLLRDCALSSLLREYSLINPGGNILIVCA